MTLKRSAPHDGALLWARLGVRLRDRLPSFPPEELP